MAEVLHLTYHYVRDEGAPGSNCPPERLRKQITALQERGFVFMTCGQVAKCLYLGIPLPEKHVTLSFDDGLKDQYTAAFPILVEFGVPATFFIISGTLNGWMPSAIGFQIAIEKLGDEHLRYKILPQLLEEYGLFSYGRLLEKERFDYSGMKMGEPPELRLIKAVFNHFLPPSLQQEFIRKIYERCGVGEEVELVSRWFMDKEELWLMARSGMEIASHTVRHPWLNMIGEEEIFDEAVRSQKQIFRTAAMEPRTFAYPFGGAVPRVEARVAVARAGYSSAWNFWSSWKKLPDDPHEIYANLYNIPRLNEQVFNP